MGIENFKPLIIPEGEEKDGKYTVQLQIYSDDLCKIWRYELFFGNCIEKGYRIRPALLKKYLDLLERARRDNLKTRKDFIENIKKKTLERLTGTKYDFIIENKEHSIIGPLLLSRLSDGENILRNYTLTEFLNVFFEKITHDDSLHKLLSDKTAFIEYSFRELYQYLSKVPEEKRPSFYSYTVIIGYLAAAFGLVITEENYYASPGKPPYYTAFLNNITRHSCTKAKNKLTAEVS